MGSGRCCSGARIQGELTREREPSPLPPLRGGAQRQTLGDGLNVYPTQSRIFSFDHVFAIRVGSIVDFSATFRAFWI